MQILLQSTVIAPLEKMASGLRLSQFNAATAIRPSTTDVRGKASPDQAAPTVTVQGEEDASPVAATVDAAGNFVREDVLLAEGANAITVNVTDKYGRTTSSVRNVTLADAPVFAYDDNGNTTGDGTWTYTWNQENRISSTTKNTNDTKIEYKYDGLGRRRQKLVYTWDTDHWSLITDHRFIYDGNNLVAELDGLDDDAILRKYVWGLDLSGTMSGAAGVGGLLAVSDGTSTHYPTYDGNGNITAYLDASDNAVYTAEYSHFGKITSETGTAPAQFGFSTIYRDADTGLFAYRFRDYDPNLGRWPARDPIGKNGGINLYAMVGNDPVGGVDKLGLKPPYPVFEGDEDRWYDPQTGQGMDIDKIIRPDLLVEKCTIIIVVGHYYRQDQKHGLQDLTFKTQGETSVTYGILRTFDKV